MGLWEKFDDPASKKFVEKKNELYKKKEELAKKMEKKGYSPSGQFHDPKFYKRN